MAKRQTTTARTRRISISRRSLRSEWGGYVFCPMIRLSGQWLRQLGFAEGQKAEIICSGGKLVITPLPAAEPQPAIAGKRKGRGVV